MVQNNQKTGFYAIFGHSGAVLVAQMNPRRDAKARKWIECLVQCLTAEVDILASFRGTQFLGQNFPNFPGLKLYTVWPLIEEGDCPVLGPPYGLKGAF
jgi:hypothetical protein